MTAGIPSNRFRVAAAAVLFAALLAGCASPSYLTVTYRQPTVQKAAHAPTVGLRIVDQRSTPALLDAQAKAALNDFTGLFALQIAQNNQAPYLLGAYHLTGLFDVAMKQRLKSAGIEVAETPTGDMPVIEIQISQFELHKDGRTWTLAMGYHAVLMRNGKERAHQDFSGQAERSLILTAQEAGGLIGDIFTEMINKFDPTRLLDQGLSNHS